MNKRNSRKSNISSGQKFGKLTTLEIINKDINNQYIWLCKCDCGKVKKVITANLKRGAVKSCGCIFKSDIPGQGGFVRIKNSYIQSAKDRNFEFKLTDEDLQIIFKMNCSYCGIEPKQIGSPSKYNKNQSQYIYNGIDRIDSKLGYVKGNVVPCCKKCNFMKGSLNFEQFMDHIELLSKRWQRYFKKKVS